MLRVGRRPVDEKIRGRIQQEGAGRRCGLKEGVGPFGGKVGCPRTPDARDERQRGLRRSGRTGGKEPTPVKKVFLLIEVVQQANGTMKTKLRAWKMDTAVAAGDSHCWTKVLGEIFLAINGQGHFSLDGRSPYKVMFNGKPRGEQALSIATRAAQTISDISE